MWAALSRSHRPDVTCCHAQQELQLQTCGVAVSLVGAEGWKVQTERPQHAGTVTLQMAGCCNAKRFRHHSKSRKSSKLHTRSAAHVRHSTTRGRRCVCNIQA